MGCRPRHLGESRIRDIRRSRQLGVAEFLGLHGHAVQLVLRGSAQHGRRALRRGGANDDQVPEALEQVFDEAPRILPGLDDAVDRGERGRGIPRADRVDDLVEQRAVGVAKERDRSLVLDGGALGTGHQLIEQGQGVTNGPAAGADDKRQHSGGNRIPSASHSVCVYSSIWAGGTSRNG